MKKLLNGIILSVKGAIMGVADIIPGVSGGTLAMILGVYDRLIESISSIFKNFKTNILFLIPIAIGMGIGILSSSFAVDFGLTNYPLATILLFVGMILGGIPMLFKKIQNSLNCPSNYLVFAIIFVFFLLYSIFSKDQTINLDNIKWFDYIILFVIGIVGAATMLMPGVSGSLTLMSLGYYELIVQECVKNILDFDKLGYHLQVLIPFGLGCVVGLILVAKLINYLLKHFEVKTYFAIFGFIFASLIIIFLKNLNGYNFVLIPFIIELIVGLALLFIGFSLSYSISNGGIYIGVFKIKSKKEESNIIEENEDY